MKISNRLPCSLPEAGHAGSFYGVRVGGVSRGWAGGGLGDLPTLLVVWGAEGMCSTLLLLQTPGFGSQLFRRGSWVFGLFVSCCP